jgi:hypothetical protein
MILLWSANAVGPEFLVFNCFINFETLLNEISCSGTKSGTVSVPIVLLVYSSTTSGTTFGVTCRTLTVL